MKFKPQTKWSFAPATIGNVSIGFDILGMAIEGAGDLVRLESQEEKIIEITTIVNGHPELPKDPRKNTAGAALHAFCEGENLTSHGFKVDLHKGIPMGSGMGGSAASAVAAVVAANSFLKKKAPLNRLLHYALAGEKIASGGAHPDNVAPCLYGGLTLASLSFQNPVIQLPFPKGISWALIHPNLEVKTAHARGILKKDLLLSLMVEQSAHLASFVAGLFKKDFQLIRQGFEDLLIEPQRASLIPNFIEIKQKVMQNKNCLGFSLSGSGPSVFLWAKGVAPAKKLAQLVQDEFKLQKIDSQIYIGSGPARGAHLRRQP